MGAMERLTRQQRQQDTRNRLLEAAARLFAERGLSASLDDVATAAGLTKGAVYSNFANKEALLLALIDRRVGKHPDNNALGMSLTDQTVSLTERMQSLAQHYDAQVGTAASRDFVLLMLEFWTAAIRSPRMRTSFTAELHRVRAGIEEQLRQWAPAGSLPAPAPDLAAMFLAIDFGLAIQHLAEPNEATGRRYATAFQLLLGEALGPDEQQANRATP